MTAQTPDSLIVESAEVGLGDFKFISVITGDIKTNDGWGEPYPFTARATPDQKHVSSSLWRGYISVYRLKESGRLILIGFEYPSHRGRQPDVIYEELVGDFWLVFMRPSYAKRIYVPFQDGTILNDRSRWISEDVPAPKERQSAALMNLSARSRREVFSSSQKLVASAGLLVLAIACIYVPFEATYTQDGDNARANIGYYFVWSPPTPTSVCLKTFGMPVHSLESPNTIEKRANRRCFLKPSFAQLAASAIGIAFATIAAFLLLGIGRRQGS